MSKNKPAQPRVIPDPAEAARHGKPSEWGVNVEALELPRNAEVARQVDYRGVLRGRWRYDCFEMLYRRRRNETTFPDAWYFAVRRFQGDLAILHRTQGASDAIRVTGRGAVGALATSGDGDGENAALIRYVTTGFGMPRVQAGERLNRVLAMLDPRDARLLRDLCEPEAATGASVNWLATVKRHTGEWRESDRGQTVRNICEALAGAYAEIDNQPRSKVA